MWATPASSTTSSTTATWPTSLSRRAGTTHRTAPGRERVEQLATAGSTAVAPACVASTHERVALVLSEHAARRSFRRRASTARAEITILARPAAPLFFTSPRLAALYPLPRRTFAVPPASPFCRRSTTALAR